MSILSLKSSYIPTLKEVPAEAELASHKLLLRAGMIRQLNSGLYSFLPLGLKVLQNIERIVREEMDAIGNSELLMPILQPKELWDESGRWDVYGPELMRLQDRHEREYALGPTHEELITDLVRNELKSYKDLPKCLYQIHWKYRDEVRPRFGLLRSREFLMKDAYSFHDSAQSLDEHYEIERHAYARICQRCGLDFVAVEANSGEIGGSQSMEFMALAEAGESELLICGKCDWAANVDTLDESHLPTKCPQCGATLHSKRGIEVGQIFKLGDKYSQAMNAKYTGADGKEACFEMGCYGWGLSRTLAAAVEQSHDDKGIIWPISLAPAQIVIVNLDSNSVEISSWVNQTALELSNQGYSVAVDDTDDRAGSKLANAELIGWPVQLIAGKRSFEQGKVELKLRNNLSVVEVDLSGTIAKTGEIIQKLL